MSFRVEKVDLRTAEESVLRGYYALEVARRGAFVPTDPPTPFEWYRAEWGSVTQYWQAQHWVITDGTEIAGIAGAEMDMVQNLDIADVWVFVDKMERGKGYGRMLATALFDWLEESGRVKPIFHLPGESEFDSLARRAGLNDALHMRRSRLHVSDIDRDLMQTWIDRAEERAGDYELILIQTPVPDEYLEAICRVNSVMNDAPFEELEREDQTTTPEMWRELEDVLARRGDTLMMYVARPRESGLFAGFTQLNYQSLLPEQAWIWNTGVHADHRNKGLGRWIKAAMAIHVLDNYPDVERFDTFNAGSNQPMLEINVAMGFKPLVVEVAWQADLATIRSSLGV